MYKCWIAELSWIEIILVIWKVKLKNPNIEFKKLKQQEIKGTKQKTLRLDL